MISIRPIVLSIYLWKSQSQRSNHGWFEIGKWEFQLEMFGVSTDSLVISTSSYIDHLHLQVASLQMKCRVFQGFLAGSRLTTTPRVTTKGWLSQVRTGCWNLRFLHLNFGSRKRFEWRWVCWGSVFLGFLWCVSTKIHGSPWPSSSSFFWYQSAMSAVALIEGVKTKNQISPPNPVKWARFIFLEISGFWTVHLNYTQVWRFIRIW